MNSQTNPEQLEGEWNFTGYFPENCKAMPECHTKRMELNLDSKGDYGHIFSTKAMMRGDTCSTEAKQFNSLGVTQAKNNKIRFGNGVSKFGFNWLSNPYYIDDDHTKEKLFIKEKNGADTCWSTFEKFDEEAEREEFRAKILYHLNKITEAQRNSLRSYRTGKFNL